MRTRGFMFIAVCTLIVALTGCGMSNRGAGTLVGAGVGAGIGAAATNSVGGAIVGGAGGAIIGNQLAR